MDREHRASQCSSSKAAASKREEMTGYDIDTSDRSQGQFSFIPKNKNEGEEERGEEADTKCQRPHVEEKVRLDEGGEGPMMSGSVITGNLNPVTIPSIIHHIGSYLTCSDLKRCRLLNKQWDEECCKHLRKKGLVKFNSKVKVLKFTSQFHQNPIFCQNFSFDLPAGLNDPEMERFFEIFGPFIKYFKLDFSQSSATEQKLNAENFYDLIFVRLPNLQELSLVGCISEGDHFLPEEKRVTKEKMSTSLSFSVRNNANLRASRSASNSPTSSSAASSAAVPADTCSVPILPQLKMLEIFLYSSSSGENVSKNEFLIELLSCVPNMKKISVPKIPRMLSFGMPLLHTLITTEQLHFDKLQHLDMDIALYNGSIDVLKSKRYPLKYLNAEINSTVSEGSLHSFLETYEKTLTTLQLKFPRSPVASSELRLLKDFQVLKHLTLHGYNGSLKFLEHLNLETFGLIDNAFTIALQRPNLSQPMKAQFSYQMIWTDFTEESYCFDCLDSSDSQLLHKFSANFPNLTSLNLPHLNDFDLRIIYENFSHSLQEMTMENPLCSDYGLTGICNGLLSSQETAKLETYRTQSFIGNMKRLRKLEILTPSINITDASINYGIIYCENLKVFILRNAAITDVGLQKLVDSMHLEYLETTMCANIQPAGVKYALEKMTKREMTYIWNNNQSRMTSCCINTFLDGNSTCDLHSSLE